MTNRIHVIIKELILKELSNSFNINSGTNRLPEGMDISRLYEKIHANTIASLISLYLSNVCEGYCEDSFHNCFETPDFTYIDYNDVVVVENIPTLCEELQIEYLNTEYYISKKGLTKKKSKKNLLEKGAVYTPDDIAYAIVKHTLGNTNTALPSELKVLDFAAGTGRFYKQVVKCFHTLFNIGYDKSILNNVYGIETDPIAVNICRLNAFSLLEDKTTSNLQIISEHITCKDALVKTNLFSQSAKQAGVESLSFDGFDAIVSNPPYLALKPNRNKMDSATVENITNMANYFRNSGEYGYAIEGMLNLYQLSLEAMLGMLKKGGQMGIICPSTLFADISATKLRIHLLRNNKVSHIKYFSEEDPLFCNVTQATCIFHLEKNGKTDNINIEQHGRTYEINIADVKKLMAANWEIPSIERIEWDIMKKLAKVQKLKDNKDIRNKRGELDITLFKEYITTEKTPYRLVRGNMISSNGIKDINGEYVSPLFLNRKSDEFKQKDFGRKRLVCQQISNQSQKVRLKFVLSEETDILGNSCNYISIADEYIAPMMAILNSALLNWRFKITSTNNHINNYELDELPIIDLNSVRESVIGKEGMERDKAICHLYNLDKEETDFILSTFYETI